MLYCLPEAMKMGSLPFNSDSNFFLSSIVKSVQFPANLPQCQQTRGIQTLWIPDFYINFGIYVHHEENRRTTSPRLSLYLG